MSRHLVGEDDHAARGRERWWRAAHDVSSWWRNDFAGDGEATAAADWLNNFAVRQLAEHAAAWNRVAADEPPQWRDATGISDYALTLDPAQLRALTGDLHTVIERHRLAAEANPADGARQVLVHVYGVPRLDPS